MNGKLSEKLKSLSTFLPELYVVGGCVRNSLLGLSNTDTDVAGKYTPDEVVSSLKGSRFTAVTVNRRLGTLKIFDRTDKGFYVEYTTFRKDSYPFGSGCHVPASVEFTTSMETDARRRDFTVNALYQKVTNGEIVDITGGLADLKSRTLRTCRAPKEVFSEDGLRLLRLVRFAAELGFKIEEQTFAAAKELAYLLDDISAERVREELIKITVADTRYSISPPDAHLRGLRLLDELGLLIRIFPELYDGKGLMQDARHHVYDVFEHNVQAYAAAPANIRLAALLHDVGKPASLKKFGNMYSHSDEGIKIVDERLGARGLKFSKSEVDTIKRLIAGHMYDLDGKACEKKLKLFIVENAASVYDLAALKHADATASRGVRTLSVSAERILATYEKMKSEGTPFSLAELHVSGTDLIEMGVKGSDISRILNKTFETAVVNPECRTRESQLKHIRGLIKNGNSNRNT